MDDGNTGISCPHDRTGNRVPKREVRPFRNVASVEDSVAQGADAVTGEEDHPLASVDARNFQGVAGRRDQARVEDVDRVVASSVVVDVVPVLGA
jgi:hypothetical protein